MSQKSSLSAQPAPSSAENAVGGRRIHAQTPFLVSWGVLLFVWSVGGGIIGLVPRMDFVNGLVRDETFPWLGGAATLVIVVLWYFSELRVNYRLVLLVLLGGISTIFAALISTLLPSAVLYGMTLVSLIIGVSMGLVFGYAGLQGGVGFSLGGAVGFFLIVGALSSPFVIILGLIGLLTGQDLALLGMLTGLSTGTLLSGFIGGTMGALRQLFDPMKSGS